MQHLCPHILWSTEKSILSESLYWDPFVCSTIFIDPLSCLLINDSSSMATYNLLYQLGWGCEVNMKRKIHIRWVSKWLNIALEYLTTHIISLTNRLNSSHSPAYESGKNDVKEKNNFEKILIRLSIHFFLFEPTSLFGKSIFYIEIDNYVTEFVKSNKQLAKMTDIWW